MKKTWYYFWIGIVLSVLILIIGSRQIDNEVRLNFVEILKKRHETNLFLIHKFKSNQTNLLQNLAHQENPIDYFDYTIGAFKEIMQLRFIDNEGNEKIRIDRLRDGTIRRIPEEELQNKADRYYFQQFIRLPKGEVGFSEFDLNVEHNKIEKPLNPTLRAGIPMYKNGKKIGVIVINYYMKNWIESLKSDHNLNFFLVDRNGYFMLHPDPHWEWSRYRSQPKKAQEYFQSEILEVNRWKENRFFWIGDDAIAFPIRFYGSTLLAVYQLNTKDNSLMVDHFAKHLLLFLLVGSVTLVPIILMIRQHNTHMNEVREKHHTLMIHQDKMNAMGNILEAIAHQWRQPLNSIGLIFQQISNDFRFGRLDAKILKQSEQRAMGQITFMSGVNLQRDFSSHAL